MRPQAAIRLVLTAGLALSVGHCAPRVVLVRGGPTPAWVDHLPRRAGQLCAVGYSGPTFYQQDCVKNAAENARGHLAESISVTIRAVTIDISDGTRGYFSKDVFVEGSKSASAVVIQGSEVQAQWVDMQGQRGSPNGCYAMVCIDPDKPIDKLVEKLEENKLPKKTVEQVRANAEAAFEELEKAEDQAQLERAPPFPPEEGHKQEADPAADEEAIPEEAAPQEEQGEEATQGPTPAIRKIELPPEEK